MKFTQEQMERAAEKWEAMYEAVKKIEAGDGTLEQAQKMFQDAYMNMTQEKTAAYLALMAHNGYIEGVEKADGKVVLPLKVKITEKGHTYFKEMIDGAKRMAVELGAEERSA